MRKKTMKGSQPKSKYLKNTVDFEKKRKKNWSKLYKYIRGKLINLILKLIKLKHSGKPLAYFTLTKPLVPLPLLWLQRKS